MKKSSTIFKWLVWSLTAIFYLYEFILRVSPSVIVPELMDSFAITASSVGILSAFYLYSYAPMQVPVGMIMDRFGVKKVLSIASIVCGLGAILFSIATKFYVAGIGRLLIGAGSSFAFIAMIYVTTYWFSPKKRAFLIGIANSLAMLGASAGTGPLAMLINVYGWRWTISFFGMFGILLGIAIYFVFKSDKSDEQVEEKTEKKDEHFFESIKLVIAKKNSWINATVALLFYITTTAFGGLWGLSFVQSVYSVSKEVAGYAMSMVFLGWLVGGPLIGFLSDYIGKRTTVIRLGIIGALVSLIVVIYFPFIHIFVVYFLLFLVGLFSSAELLSFSLAIEMNSFKAKATAAAFTNFLISCGDAIVQPLIGFLLDLNWSGNITNNVRIYAVKDYQVALLCLPIALIVAFFMLFFIKEKKIKAL